MLEITCYFLKREQEPLLEHDAGFKPAPCAWKARMLVANTNRAYINLHFIFRDAELDNVNTNNLTYLNLACNPRYSL